MLLKRIGIRRCDGFTLLEILVALAVVGVAVSVFVSMFASSLKLAGASRHETVAAGLAEEQLELLRVNPTMVAWPLSGAPGQLVELKPVTPAADNAAVPAAVPSDARSAKREKNLYGDFAWRWFAKTPEPADNHVEVSVVVHWLDAGKDRTLTLSTAVPRRLVPASPSAPEVKS